MKLWLRSIISALCIMGLFVVIVELCHALLSGLNWLATHQAWVITLGVFVFFCAWLSWVIHAFLADDDDDLKHS